MFGFFGLGKQRTKLGRWIDNRGIKQEWLVRQTGLGRTTISNACSDPDYIPSGKTMRLIMRALKTIDPSVQAEHFWDI